MIDGETVPCRHCSKPTHMIGTELCDWCRELEIRIRQNTALARKILKSIEPTPEEIESQAWVMRLVSLTGDELKAELERLKQKARRAD